MAHAYTPGLKVTDSTLVVKRRRLPILGEVLVKKGDRVTPDTIVARTKIPGDPETLNVATKLGLEAEDVPEVMLVKEGDFIKKGQVIALKKSFFGLFKTPLESPIDGTVDNISTITGQITLRGPAIPIEIHAYIPGVVDEVLDREGVVVSTPAALIQGIFGVGGERQGELVVAVKDPSEVLTGDKITPNMKGKVVVGGSLVTLDAIRKGDEVGVAGLVAGGIIDKDLVEFLGYDIGVAITGQEDIDLTIILTEGFGQIRMADKTFHLLQKLNGKVASINGATQIRAGVMRPEIIVALDHLLEKQEFAESEAEGGMAIGTHLRIIREPWFGKLATVVELPPELHVIESGSKARVLVAELADGTRVTVPRANVELIEE
ncbi:MAG: hypothetical protein ACOX2K_09705 [Bacillota bacterium]|jgi:hypothetical protein